MAEPLRDLRAKVHATTWCAIEAEHRATGREHSEIVRDVLHAWASQRIAAATVLPRLLAVEGIAGQPGDRL
jgi:hypothetical protein